MRMPQALPLRSLPFASCLVLLLSLSHCQAEPKAPAAASGGAAAPAVKQADSGGPSGVIARASVESCAGFTVDKAAGILGVAAADLADKSEWASWSDQQRQCLFGKKDDAMAPAVWFNMTIEESPETAQQEMARLHENAGIATKSIDAVTGGKTEDVSDARFAGIGDEAFWVSATDALAVRKGNVTALVGVSGIEEDRIGKTTTVAREVVAGLR